MKVEELYLQLVCDELKVSPKSAISKSRKREFVEARQITSFLLYLYTKMNNCSIARFVNYESHASVIRDRSGIPNLIKTNKDFRVKTKPIFNKARILAREINAAENQKREETDKIFSNQKEEDWYKEVYYAESLILPL